MMTNFDYAAFLADVRKRPFKFRTMDCGIIIADLWLGKHGEDPMLEYRDMYWDEKSCKDFLAKQWGLPVFVARLAREMGAKRITEPEPEAFAVVRMESGHFGAIRTLGGRWGIKHRNGFSAYMDPLVVAMWSSN